MKVLIYAIIFPLLLLAINGQYYSQNARTSYNSYTKNLANVLRRNGFTQFYNLLRRAGMYSVLYEQDAYTVFVPTNEIIQKHLTSITDVKNYVEFHIVKGKYDVSQIQDGTLLKTYKGNSVIVNKHYDHVWKKVKLWIQGFEAVNLNIEAGNSKLYQIESFLQRQNQSVYSYLRESGKYKLFFQLFDQQKIYFQFPFGTTIFAPLDSAFQKLPDTYKAKLFSSDQQVRHFIRSHIISRPMCRSRLFYTSGWINIKNSIGRYFSLYQDIYNVEASYVFGGRLLTSKVLSEGFVYGITEIILPDIERKTLQQIEYLKCFHFTQLLIQTGHLALFSNVLHYYTIFAPSDQAFENLSDDVKKRMKNDPEYLLSVVQYHIARGRYLSQNFNPIKKIKTKAFNQRSNENLNVVSYYGNEVSTVQNSVIVGLDNLAINGIIHLVDQVLLPPSKTLYEIIQTSKKLKEFKEFLHLWNETSILKNLNNSNGVYWTILAPTNKGLKRFYELKLNEKIKFKDFIFRHILPVPFFTRQINEGNEESLDTLAMGNIGIFKLKLQRPSEPNKRIRIPDFDAEIIKENLIGKNGVIHIVNEVFHD